MSHHTCHHPRDLNALTRAEERFLEEWVKHGTLLATAEALGVTYKTAANCSKSIREKLCAPTLAVAIEIRRNQNAA